MSTVSSPPPPSTAGPSSLETVMQSILLILFSEIGDKTFLISALLAMRHPRLLVFCGALASLLLMSALSASLGHILPSLIPRTWTQLAAAVLFLFFGLKMAAEARKMTGDVADEKMREEMKEAEEEIAEDDGEDVPMESLEEGRAENVPPSPTRSQKKSGWLEGARNFSSLIFGPVFVQSFVLTFLGEWGDRSQIATIALGAAHNVYLVTLGTILGHSCCTALAVIGGRYISTKISVKHVTWGGASLFFIFGVVYFYEACVEWGNVEVPLALEVNNRL
ncbi:vacuole protein [Macrolepiota fuliginosa MF-IS2]|uniref:GDT1 family protein n=1 Tax=Macrolepiota fuliginosa MF-IS2 TaxID=1400762 RepID=A0A9P5X9R7_9AGAR|nr:vacuole protein [Macrolepiota fuliginosa MF-IS2]